MPNVLVVDDEPSLVQFVGMVLEQNGYTVLQASNGVEALMVYSSYHTRVDVVLTDVQMPGMNGIELAKRFRALNPLVRILLMSGYVPDDLEIPPGLMLLEKPFMPKQLIRALEQTLAVGLKR
jgi:CheY-like chemotaxis protein